MNLLDLIQQGESKTLELKSQLPQQGLLILLGQPLHVATQCARFKGVGMDVFLDRKEYTGDLFTQLEQTEIFIKNHLHLRGEIKGLQRTDTLEIPEAALREALINAIIHRDYTNPGRDIKVGIYDDIVNIVSPGGLPSTLTTETLTDGRSEIRNRVIARIFKELGYIEQWGSGIQRIKSTCLAQGLAEPRIREKGDFVDVEFYRPAPDKAEIVPDKVELLPVIAELEAALDQDRLIPPDSARFRPIPPDLSALHPDERQLMEHLSHVGTLTRKDAAALLQAGETKVKALFQALIKNGFIKRMGQGRATYYVITKGRTE